jgi:DNA-binding MarR family transcriptional regulator
LTPKSAPILKQIAAFRRELHDEMAEGLEATELDTLVDCLQRMRTRLTKHKAANSRASTA